MPKIGLTKLKATSFSGWPFVVIAGLALALLAIVDRGGLNDTITTTTPTAPASATAAVPGGCRLLVTIDELKVRAGPSQDTELLRTLARGEEVDGTSVQTNLYRQLGDGSWASTEFLTPVAGSNCT
jgi:hypothetical protein